MTKEDRWAIIAKWSKIENSKLNIIVGDMLSPVGLQSLDKKNMLIPMGDAWQNFVMKQNNALLPKESPLARAVQADPEATVKLLISSGYNPEDAQILVDRASYMSSIQEQVEHLKTLFVSKIIPNVKNPNDASEIERYITMHPELIYDNPHLEVLVNKLRPGSLKTYAKYFAEALATIPTINILQKNLKHERK